jgi:hypothetical protein
MYFTENLLYKLKYYKMEALLPSNNEMLKEVFMFKIKGGENLLYVPHQLLQIYKLIKLKKLYVSN